MVKIIMRYIFTCLFFTGIRVAYTQDLTQYVNPMIGTGAHGHTFPGPTLPFSLVQVSPDERVDGWDWCSGYNYMDSTIMGFSHTHLSGTGISDLGDVLIVPTTGKVAYVPGNESKPGEGYRSAFSHRNEKAAAGYYSVMLDDHHIRAELTATQRVGMHRYTFPASDSSNILIDLGHTIYDANRSKVVDSRIDFEDRQTVSGYKVMRGWAPIRKLFYVIKFSKPYKDFGINNRTGLKFNTGGPMVGRITFSTGKDEQVLLKVGISVVSLENARENLKEISGWNFDQVVQQAKETWNTALQKIKVEGTPQQKEIFYTAMYHAMIAPNNIADANGQHTGPDFNIHTSKTGNFYSTFSLWDTYRAANPLYTLIEPQRTGDMVNSMLDHFDQYGFLPVWALMGTENHCMIANHSVPVIVDAYLKNPKGIDGERAYHAIKTTLTKDHRNSNWQYYDYDRRGYVSYDLEAASVSKTMEFAFNDWCAAQLALKLGKKDDYAYFSKRALFYKNLFHPQHHLVWPRDTKGNWMPDFKPAVVAYKGQFTEANAWQNTWSVQHDVQGLINLFPSKEKFLEKLDSTFAAGNDPVSDVPDVSGLIGQYAHGNEPSHHIAYLYNYAGQPWKTQQLAHRILTEQYTNRPDGIAGNEDCGQMSAWYVLSSMGLYPVNPASGIYDIGSPLWPQAEIDAGNGNKFLITAKNVSDRNYYIRSAKLNGKPYNKVFITHADIVKGGTLEFVMGDQPNKKWGVAPDSVAPSMSGK